MTLILDLKWERIAMGFVVGYTRILCKLMLYGYSGSIDQTYIFHINSEYS